MNLDIWAIPLNIFSRPTIWETTCWMKKIPSSGMWRCVDPVKWTDVPQKRRYISQDLHGVTSTKSVFFIVTAVKTQILHVLNVWSCVFIYFIVYLRLINIYLLSDKHYRAKLSLCVTSQIILSNPLLCFVYINWTFVKPGMKIMPFVFLCLVSCAATSRWIFFTPGYFHFVLQHTVGVPLLTFFSLRWLKWCKVRCQD